MTNPVPLPEPVDYGYRDECGTWVQQLGHDADQLRTHAAAQSAADNAELRADRQRKIGALARYRIEASLVDQLLEEGPNTETTAMDMEYWNDQHDQLKGVLQERDALRADNIRLQNEVVGPLRERVKVLEGALVRTTVSLDRAFSRIPLMDMCEVLSEARAALDATND